MIFRHRWATLPELWLGENQSIEESKLVSLVKELSQSERLRQKRTLEQVGLVYLDLDKRIFELSDGESQQVASKIILRSPFILAETDQLSFNRPSNLSVDYGDFTISSDDNRLIIIATHNPAILGDGWWSVHDGSSK